MVPRPHQMKWSHRNHQGEPPESETPFASSSLPLLSVFSCHPPWVLTLTSANQPAKHSELIEDVIRVKLGLLPPVESNKATPWNVDGGVPNRFIVFRVIQITLMKMTSATTDGNISHIVDTFWTVLQPHEKDEWGTLRATIQEVHKLISQAALSEDAGDEELCAKCQGKAEALLDEIGWRSTDDEMEQASKAGARYMTRKKEKSKRRAVLGVSNGFSATKDVPISNSDQLYNPNTKPGLFSTPDPPLSTSTRTGSPGISHTGPTAVEAPDSNADPFSWLYNSNTEPGPFPTLDPPLSTYTQSGSPDISPTGPTAVKEVPDANADPFDWLYNPNTEPGPFPTPDPLPPTSTQSQATITPSDTEAGWWAYTG